MNLLDKEFLLVDMHNVSVCAEVGLLVVKNLNSLQVLIVFQVFDEVSHHIDLLVQVVVLSLCSLNWRLLS